MLLAEAALALQTCRFAWAKCYSKSRLSFKLSIFTMLLDGRTHCILYNILYRHFECLAKCSSCIMRSADTVKKKVYHYKNQTVVWIVHFSLQIWKDHQSSYWELFSTRLLDSCYLHQSKCSVSPCLYFLVCWQQEIWGRFNPLEAAEVSIFIQSSRSSLKNRRRLTPMSLN